MRITMECGMSKLRQIVNLDSLKKQLEEIDTDTILMVVDTTVYNIYRKEFDFLKWKNKKVHLWKCLEGESTKVFDELKNCVEFFLSRGIHRNAHLVAFGGGACSDFAGLVAALLLRGISWSVVPTTTLAMIDAAIGGKVAINSESGKNLIGAFHMPENIYFVYQFNESLDRATRQCGNGELFKYAFLDIKIYSAIINGAKQEDVIALCAEYKQKIVEDDFKESNKRKILNLGHTFGHAIERIYKIPHGVAVAWGMVIIFTIFDQEKNLIEMKKLLEFIDLDLTESPWHNKSFPIEEIMNLVARDKKSISQEEIEVILLDEIGLPSINKVSFIELEKKLREKQDVIRKFMF